MEIIFEFVKIFIEINKAFKNADLYNSLSEIIKQSNILNQNGFENNDDNYEFTVIFAYMLLDNLLHLNDKILEYFAERKIITSVRPRCNVCCISAHPYALFCTMFRNQL